MRGKLIRITGIYTLLGEDDKMIASDDVDMQKDYQIGKLSKQNCDEIFGMVDVEKLADEYVLTINNEDQHVDAKLDFIEGFNKAMDLNKDKVFTLEDMRTAYNDGIANIDSDGDYIDRPDEDFLDTINTIKQPTEIEVDIEMEVVNHCDCQCHTDGVTMHFMACCNPDIVPKLDDNNNLILRRI